MNMNSYRSALSNVGNAPYDGYQVHGPLRRTKVNQRTQEYSSSMHIEEPPMYMQSEQNVLRNSDGAEEPGPADYQEASSSEVPWHDGIDLNNMTYEELLDLGEAIGTQSRGLSQEIIRLLLTSRCKASGFFSRKKSRESYSLSGFK